MMDGDDYDDGPVTILRNSTFLYNRAGVQDGGVASIRGWASVAVEGDGNVFAYNESPDSGAVFSAEDDTSITIEGGHFFNNLAEKVECRFGSCTNWCARETRGILSCEVRVSHRGGRRLSGMIRNSYRAKAGAVCSGAAKGPTTRVPVLL